MSSGGKSVKVGYRYFFGIHMLVSRGEVDELVEIKVGGKTAWSGSVTSNASLQINAPELFGGDDGEGGIQGRLDVMMGGPTQSVNAALASMLGGLVPAFRGMFTLFYDGLVTSMNPYPKPWTFRVRRALKGWDGPVWYPEKAVITLTDPETGGAIKAMNPAHILYELETNHDWGRGKDRSRLDDAAFRAAADQLYSEGLGLCLRWVRTDSIDSFAGSVLDHIAGNLFTSRNTGLRKLTLVRSDYVVDNLPHFAPEKGLLEIQEDDNSAGADAANEVVVTWRNPIDNSKRPARERNLAAIRAAGGRVISVATEYIGLPTYDLAARIAKRDLRAKVSAKRWKLVLDRRGRDIEPGAAFRFSAPARGLSNIVVRAGRVDDGTLEKGAITITAVLDVFGMPATTFSAPPPSGWVPPNSTPQAVTTRALAEVTWRDLVQSMDAANLQLLDASTCFLGVLAARPTGLSLGYQLQTRVGSAAFETRAGGDFCPTAVLVAALPQAAGAVTIGLSSGVDLDLVRVGSTALVDSEVVRVDALDVGAMTVTLARGCVDSVPADHVAGARIWFFDDFSGVDPTEYTSGTAVEARLLTHTSSGLLDPVLASTISLTLTGRSARPYPPGKLQIGGAAYPAVFTGDVVLTWAHRDRLLQADQVVDTVQGSIGPEPGTTYEVEVYNQSNALVHSQTGISATTYTVPSGLFSTATRLTVRVYSRRGGLRSLQALSASFDYTAGAGAPDPVVAVTSTASATATSLAMSVPAGAAAGDTVLALLRCRSDRTFAVPSGWTSVLDTAIPAGTTDSSGTRLYVLRKLWVSGETSYTFTQSVNAACSGMLLLVRGVLGGSALSLGSASASLTKETTSSYILAVTCDNSYGAVTPTGPRVAGYKYKGYSYFLSSLHYFGLFADAQAAPAGANTVTTSYPNAVGPHSALWVAEIKQP